MNAAETPDVAEWLREARELGQAAATGPWGAPIDSDGTAPLLNATDAYVFTGESGYVGGEADADDATFIADARTRLPQALAALGAVLELHEPSDALQVSHARQLRWCEECSDPEGGMRAIHPCATVRAIAAALGVTAQEER